MNILMLTGPLAPTLDTNANLLLRLLPAIREKHHVQILSASFAPGTVQMPETWEGTSVCWTDLTRATPMDAANRLKAQLLDRRGYSDALLEARLLYALKQLHKKNQFDVLLTSMEPFVAAAAAADLPDVKHVLYLMDPPELLTRGDTTPYRKFRLPRILAAQDLILTTPFISEALRKSSLRKAFSSIEEVGFPQIMTEKKRIPPSGKKKDVVDLLFCGWLYSDIRSPQYFLDIVSRLNERFEVTFMGKECEKLQECFPIKTKASIITLPNQPYDVALQAMADADVLINIGNSVPVHMPSKTLEYINTGKPMVNFYKFADCPTLYYTNRYPLALNLFEEEKDMDAAAAQFVRFCEDSLCKTVDHDWIESEFANCTPRYIAQKILESLEK